MLQWREVRGDCSLCLWERSDYVTTALRHCSPRTVIDVGWATSRRGIPHLTGEFCFGDLHTLEKVQLCDRNAVKTRRRAYLKRILSASSSYTK